VTVTLKISAEAYACVTVLPEPSTEPSPKFQLKLTYGRVPPLAVALKETGRLTSVGLVLTVKLGARGSGVIVRL
jgi:hypothetical protein